MGRVIAVANQKGGVGYGKLVVMKSWTCEHTSLRHSQAHVLFIIRNTLQ